MKWVVRGAGGERQVEVEPATTGLKVTIDGRARPVEITALDGAAAALRFADDGASFHVAFAREAKGRWRVALAERELLFEVLTPVEAAGIGSVEGASGPARIEAPIPGKVVAVNVVVGDAVTVGQSLIVLEAMKMENELTAEREGTVARIHVAEGEAVEAGALLVEVGGEEAGE